MQTLDQLTRAELFFARSPGDYTIRLRFDIFATSLPDGLKILDDADGERDQQKAKKKILELARNDRSRVVDSFSTVCPRQNNERSIVKMRSNKKGPRPVQEDDDAHDPEQLHSTELEVEAFYDPHFHVVDGNFLYRRISSNSSQRAITTTVSCPVGASVIAASWTEGDTLEILFFEAHIERPGAITRVRGVDNSDRAIE